MILSKTKAIFSEQSFSNDETPYSHHLSILRHDLDVSLDLILERPGWLHVQWSYEGLPIAR
jgi:hypothetical protein